MSSPSNYEQITRNIVIDGNDDSPYYDGHSSCNCSNLSSNYDQTCTTKACFNYMTLTECIKCSSSLCQNNKFQKLVSVKLDVRSVEHKGYGLFALEDINAQQFIKEYVGEIVSSNELQRRFEALFLSVSVSLSLSVFPSLTPTLSPSDSFVE
jgi:hypothetical protein